MHETTSEIGDSLSSSYRAWLVLRSFYETVNMTGLEMHKNSLEFHISHKLGRSQEQSNYIGVLGKGILQSTVMMNPKRTET